MPNQPEPQDINHNQLWEWGNGGEHFRTHENKHGKHRPFYFRDYYLANREKLKEYSKNCYQVKKALRESNKWHETSYAHSTQYIYPKKTTYNKRKSDTKTSDTKLFNTKKGGRPRIEKPLNNQERQQRKRLKKKLNQLWHENQKPVINLIDKENIRVKTKGKEPKRTDWRNRPERLTAEQLKRNNGELGARTGIKVNYRGNRQYFIYVLDEDHNKPNKKIPDEVRREIEARGIERNKKWGIGSNKTTNGRHTIILSREPLAPIALQYGVYQPSDFLGLGQQFIVNGPGKEWEGSKRVLIVKDFWELKRKLEKWGYKVINKNTQIINKIRPTNIKVYQQQKHKQNIRQNIKEGQTFNIIELVNETKELKPTKNMREPHLIKTTAHQFRAEFYHKNQEKIKLYLNKTAKLTLKWGHTHLFLNKIWNNAT